jgi:acetylglutamate kinase
MLIDKRYIPVISPMGLGDDGQGYNLSADAAAAQVAIAVKAEKLIYLTNVPGVMEAGELISELTAAQLRDKIKSGVVTGGMMQKAESVLAALAGGVKRVHVVDGRTPHNVVAELFTDRGAGTLITP